MRDRRPARMLCGRTLTKACSVMKTDVLVLGAGIVGVSSALHLLDRGRSVVLVDRADPGSGTSYGNAGLIERSSVIPYSFPRDPRALLRYALNGQSDVRYDPFFLPKAASFLWRYWLNSAPGPLEVATRAMLPLVEACLPEHDRLVARAGAGHLIRADGWVALYKTTARFDAAVAEAGRLSLWPRPPHPDAAGLHRARARLPARHRQHCRCHSLAGPENGDRSARPGEGLCELFVAGGGTMARGDAATLTEIAGGWQVTGADGETITAREVVVALGPQSGSCFARRAIASRSASSAAITATTRRRTAPCRACRWWTRKAAMCWRRCGRVCASPPASSSPIPQPPPTISRSAATRRRPQASAARTAGGANALARAAPLPAGHAPVIGPAPRHTGLWFHFGHAHHGLTLGPASGRLLAEMMTGETPFVDPAPYAATRFA